MTEKVRVSGQPSKDFFIDMITRDISIENCILDLLDNSVDAALKTIRGQGRDAFSETLDGYTVSLTLSDDDFQIVDNCGGMSIDDAKSHAFHFGSSLSLPQDKKGLIGFYGIGMKRAFFRMGSVINIESNTEQQGFDMEIDVERWRAVDDTRAADDWDFELDPKESSGDIGVKIKIRELREGIDSYFRNPTYISNLRALISKIYSFLIYRGLRITLNDIEIQGINFEFKTSEEFRPLNHDYTDQTGVNYNISVGLRDVLPDDGESDTPSRDQIERSGWYVTCNDRIILAANKTEQSVWSVDTFPAWHSQYSGFLGLIRFRSNDPSKLPWTTTKRDVVSSHPLYRRAVVHMKSPTRQFIDYTNSRKKVVAEARKKEEAAGSTSVYSLPANPSMKLPAISATPRIIYQWIQFQKPLTEIRSLKSALGKPWMSNVALGQYAFDYLRRSIVDEEE